MGWLILNPSLNVMVLSGPKINSAPKCMHPFNKSQLVYPRRMEVGNKQKENPVRPSVKLAMKNIMVPAPVQPKPIKQRPQYIPAISREPLF